MNTTVTMQKNSQKEPHKQTGNTGATQTDGKHRNHTNRRETQEPHKQTGNIGATQTDGKHTSHK
jgi:hypothetical protein